MKVKISGIYGILNKTTNKIYIGSARNITERWYRHKTDLRFKNHHSQHLQRAWDKHGEEAFEFKIIEMIENTTKEALLEREQYWMDFYNSANPDKGYNLYPIARSSLGYKQPVEIRAKRIGKKLSAEHIKNLSSSHMGQIAWNTGKKHTESHKAALKKAWILRKQRELNNDK